MPTDTVQLCAVLCNRLFLLFGERLRYSNGPTEIGPPQLGSSFLLTNENSPTRADRRPLSLPSLYCTLDHEICASRSLINALNNMLHVMERIPSETSAKLCFLRAEEISRWRKTGSFKYSNLLVETSGECSEEVQEMFINQCVNVFARSIIFGRLNGKLRKLSSWGRWLLLGRQMCYHMCRNGSCKAAATCFASPASQPIYGFLILYTETAAGLPVTLVYANFQRLL